MELVHFYADWLQVGVSIVLMDHIVLVSKLQMEIQVMDVIKQNIVQHKLNMKIDP